ncbi:transcription elongation factor GreA [Paenibacillus phyllosphaerae]|uniref:Transcription elongation factor GreA n=1 Tax=Paenibacillus phyllosphaerae TaxID=274593 RepID=A0A7W5FQD2_9BACL|nr:GreA/GreB family elongation factor [Paenibacillus phyllosphaerae]MBB3113350.1 transcription elongation factor GreA [Paenibacillus phyllosphaerae]
MNNFDMRDRILQQLVRLEESKTDFLDHFPLPAGYEERRSVAILMERYVHRLEKLLFFLTHDSGFRLNFVIIDSTVTIMNTQLNTLESYKICFPDNSEVDAGHISFLSPIGRQLLLAPIYTNVNLTVPDGECEYVVNQITFS